MFLNDDNKLRIQKLLKAFSVAQHFHLNKKGGYFKLYYSHPDTKARVNAAYRDEMREIFFPPNEITEGKRPSDEDFELICEAYESGSHVPLLILSFMRRTVIENEPSINPVYGKSMDDQISNLTTSLGGCERILRTPLPVSLSEDNRTADYFFTFFPYCFFFSCHFTFCLPNQNRLRLLRIQVGMYQRRLWLDSFLFRSNTLFILPFA